MDDRHRIEAIVCRGVWAGLYPAERPAAAQLVEDYDDTLFSRLPSLEQHIAHGLLTAQSDHDYNLRPRPHNLSLSHTTDHCNFIHGLAFKTRINTHYPPLNTPSIQHPFAIHSSVMDTGC